MKRTHLFRKTHQASSIMLLMNPRKQKFFEVTFHNPRVLVTRGYAVRTRVKKCSEHGREGVVQYVLGTRVGKERALHNLKGWITTTREDVLQTQFVISNK